MSKRKSNDGMEQAKKNCELLLNTLLSFSLNLVRFTNKSCKEPKGVATGFLIQKGKKVYLLSAGHAMRRKAQWYWETNIILEQEREVLCLPVGPFHFLKGFVADKDGVLKGKLLDVAWCEIDLQKLKLILTSQPRLAAAKLELSVYQGPLDTVPILKKEPYSFAAQSRATLVPLGTLFLRREACFETCMEYESRKKDGRYVFRLDGLHKGHKHYQGVSGAPIAAPDGKIVSMVLGGHAKKNQIFGLDLARFTPLIGLS